MISIFGYSYPQISIFIYMTYYPLPDRRLATPHGISLLLKMKPSRTGSRWCCTGKLWWIPIVCVRYVVKWRRGCWRTIHSLGKTFREAIFVIKQLPSIDRYFVPLTGHSQKYGAVEWLEVAPVHNVMSGELFSASRVLWGFSFAKKNHMIGRGFCAKSHTRS